VAGQAFRVTPQGKHNTKWGGRRIVLQGETAPRVSVHGIGRGKLILCPIPVEVGDYAHTVAKVYRYAAKEAGVELTYHIDAPKPGFFIYPIEYEKTVMYTVINEGFEDTVCFTDAKTGAKIKATIKAQSGIKFWLNMRGELAAAYGHGKLCVGERVFEAEERAVFFEGKMLSMG